MEGLESSWGGAVCLLCTSHMECVRHGTVAAVVYWVRGSFPLCYGRLQSPGGRVRVVTVLCCCCVY